MSFPTSDAPENLQTDRGANALFSSGQQLKGYV